MANQINPNTFSMMCRCPLKDAAIIRKRAFREGVTVNACMANLIHEHVKYEEPGPEMENWIAERYEANLQIRARADEDTAAGRYRSKPPKKRGRPPKAKKPGRPAKTKHRAHLRVDALVGTAI